jgi:hypothetical protein
VKASDLNTNNHHERDPYYIDKETDTLVIDTEWWETEVPEKAKSILANKGVSFVFGTVPIPHEWQTEDRRLTQVYQSFQEAFEMQHWFHECDEIFRNNAICFKVEKPRDLEEDTLTKRIDSALDHNVSADNGWFVKTGCTSGKNTVPLSPCYNSAEIARRLLQNKEIQQREWNNLGKESWIFLFPWNSNISSRNEFRGFVANNRMTCLSPQKYWICHEYTTEELESLEKAVASVSRFLYSYCVVDFWVDFETGTFHLIEYNCFGDHSGAGSSLFNWVVDHDLLYGKSNGKRTEVGDCEIRFLSIFKMSKE